MLKGESKEAPSRIRMPTRDYNWNRMRLNLRGNLKPHFICQGTEKIYISKHTEDGDEMGGREKIRTPEVLAQRRMEAKVIKRTRGEEASAGGLRFPFSRFHSAVRLRLRLG